MLSSGCSDGALERLGWSDLFGSESASADPELAARIAAERAAPIPGADGDYPSLAAVPDEAPAVTSADRRERIADSLFAVREGDRAAAPPVAPAGPASAMVAGASGAVLVRGAVHAAVIYFAHGSIRLSASDKTVLKRVADTQRARRADVRVVGHASSRGSGGEARVKVANFRTALDRAHAVAGELARLGVPAERILIESRSDDDPAWSNTTTLGEAANRRTDIYFLAPADPG